MLPALDTPEIIFGLCSPIGTDNRKVSEIITRVLRNFDYTTRIFKVTELMESMKIQGMDLHKEPTEIRYDNYIKYANRLRELSKSNAVLAMLCCAAIRNHRREKIETPTGYLPENAYIFDQFKRPEEIQVLRQVYGKLFVLISIYSDKDQRTQRLAKRIAHDRSATKVTDTDDNAAKALVQRDEDEEGQAAGQRMRDAFPLADLFINIDDEREAEKLLERFLKCLFGANDISPTRDEYGMYMAKSASLRSLDLSRQVGAAIFTKRGEVVTLGCNEVPKTGGGTYWSDDPTDDRDYKRGVDENERIKVALLVDVVKRLCAGDFLKEQKSENEIVKYVNEQASRRGSPLRDAYVMDLLEYGRVVHAEMSAISDAARLGRPIADSVLYCTTFPCHICAKHIVASGIGRVVYIEPYPKSYAEDLLSSIVVQAGAVATDKVPFSPFIGVSPLRFRDIFERGRRKDEKGKFQPWAEGKPKLIVRYTVATYLMNEAALTAMLAAIQTDLERQALIAVPPPNTTNP
jgi:cytidine deaminase